MFPVILLFDYHGNCQNYSTLLGLNFFTITMVFLFLHVEGRSVCWSPVTVGGCYDKIRKRLGFTRNSVNIGADSEISRTNMFLVAHRTFSRTRIRRSRGWRTLFFHHNWSFTSKTLLDVVKSRCLWMVMC